MKIHLKIICFTATLLLLSSGKPVQTIKESSFCKSLVPGNFILPAEDGWWNWCMAPIYDENEKLHVFMSTIPNSGRWVKDSKIVHFIADSPDGPYQFVDTTFSSNSATYHNPQVSKVGDTYVLVYMVKDRNTPRIQQEIGIATTKSLNDPWVESPHNPILKASGEMDGANIIHASNPTFLVDEDGKFRIYYKSVTDKYKPKLFREISLAISDNIEGPYENFEGNPLISYADEGLDIEDPYAFYYKGMYHLIVEDRMDVKSLLEGNPTSINEIKLGGNRPGLIYQSKDGIEWGRPQIGYKTNDFYFDQELARCERPNILWKDGKPECLFIACHDKDPTAGFFLRIKPEEGNIHPYWAPKTWQLRADDVTTIMGFRAQLEGNLNHADRPTPTVVNNAFIRGFDTENDIMTWTVDAPEEDNYSVALLYTGSKAILSQSSLEVTSGDVTIIEKANVPSWETRPFVQRHDLKQYLKLKKGINKITFRLVNFQGTEAEREALNNIKNEKGRTNPFALWSIELVRPEALIAMKDRAKSTKADVQWMVDGKYGLFVHFSSGSVPFNGGPRLGDQYQKLVDAFDVDAFVEKVVETGASWVTFTCAHGTQHWPGPSKTIDRVKPGFTCERDLIRELIDGLAKHDIRLMLYYNPNSGMEDLYGNTYGDGDSPDPTGYFDFLESHFREVSLRYGEDLATTAGYIDDCGWKVYQLDPPWEKLAKAIKAGNPNAPVGFSQNLFANLTPFSDLVVSDGAGREPEIQPAFLFEEGGQLEGQHPASWFYMDGWSSRTGNGVFTQEPKFSAEQYIEIFKKADEANMPITINLAMTPDVTKEHPFFNPVCIDIMKQVGKAVKGY